jgi:hypothetical protein
MAGGWPERSPGDIWLAGVSRFGSPWRMNCGQPQRWAVARERGVQSLDGPDPPQRARPLVSSRSSGLDLGPCSSSEAGVGRSATRRSQPGDCQSGGHEREPRHGRSARPRSADARAGPGEAWPRGCSSSFRRVTHLSRNTRSSRDARVPLGATGQPFRVIVRRSVHYHATLGRTARCAGTLTAPDCG